MVRWGALLSAAAEGKKVNKFYYKARACVCVCALRTGGMFVSVCALWEPVLPMWPRLGDLVNP